MNWELGKMVGTVNQISNRFQSRWNDEGSRCIA